MSAWLWTIDDLVAATGGRIKGEAPQGVCGLSIDTRTIKDGEAYLAIKGDVHDGHKFVAAARAAGAGLSIVSEAWVDRLEGETGPLLVVSDVLAAMEQMGIAARARTNARIVAVTGSVGKTSTKEALRHALEPSGQVHAAVASFNNHWGVPLTLARMPQETDFGVIEIGMNHPGEITPLVQMARPHVVIITNVAAVHLGAFNSVDEIALAKSEIFAGLEPGGTAVLNADDERLSIMESEAARYGVENIVRFGAAESADARSLKVVLHGSCTCLTTNILGDEMVVKVGTPGAHIAQNCLAVLAASRLLGADLAKAGLALADMKAVKGRGERHLLDFKGGKLLLIDESYNANPTSMRAAIELLAVAPVKGRGRRVAVLGDMLELGPTSRDLHAGLADDLKDRKIDHVFTVGPHMVSLFDALKGSVSCDHADTIDDAVPEILSGLQPGDAVMAKASLGTRFAVLINKLTETDRPTGGG